MNTFRVAFNPALTIDLAAFISLLSIVVIIISACRRPTINPSVHGFIYGCTVGVVVLTVPFFLTIENLNGAGS